ncbi:MAG: type II toxin-antitoxin system HicA family toxin [Caldilineaceae bacterium SB0661_bin_32]|uniref:Type II toxin-antitoxin system HicA family toxin n=1 Tax=Caldilineaceae bacterium SB0661_bin_32 TaxID=2605255 RepID=A0A6B1D7U7_9CHLR|nr:type II toxin-antitoxin system HicA family toxin [Caldilineaceae bacterium SB0661_bin_32]
MPMKPKEVLKILKDNGFERIRQSGSHVILKGEIRDESNNITVRVVVVPDHGEIPVGTLNDIVNRSGLGRKAFTR